jgi:hypothetical protein
MMDKFIIAAQSATPSPITLRPLSSQDRTVWTKLWYQNTPAIPSAKPDEDDVAHRARLSAHYEKWDPDNAWDELAAPLSTKHVLVATDSKGNIIGCIHLSVNTPGIFSVDDVIIDREQDSFNLRFSMNEEIQQHGRREGWFVLNLNNGTETMRRNVECVPAVSAPSRSAPRVMAKAAAATA